MNFILLIAFGCETLLVSMFTFGLFAVDKVNAQETRRFFRIPERTLIFFSVIGGCFGALAAMILLRHKTNYERKSYFNVSVFCAIGVWIVTLILLIFF